MDLRLYTVTKNDINLHLRPIEFKILQCFMESPNKILSRDGIIHAVWGHNINIDTRTIDIHINRLRTILRSVSKDNKKCSLIKTARSSGYYIS